MQLLKILHTQHHNLKKALKNVLTIGESENKQGATRFLVEYRNLALHEDKLLKSIKVLLELNKSFAIDLLPLFMKNTSAINNLLGKIDQLIQDFDTDTESLPDTVILSSSAESADERF